MSKRVIDWDAIEQAIDEYADLLIDAAMGHDVDEDRIERNNHVATMVKIHNEIRKATR